MDEALPNYFRHQYYKNCVSLSLHVLGCDLAGRVVEWVGSDFCAPKLMQDVFLNLSGERSPTQIAGVHPVHASGRGDANNLNLQLADLYGARACTLARGCLQRARGGT